MFYISEFCLQPTCVSQCHRYKTVKTDYTFRALLLLNFDFFITQQQRRTKRLSTQYLSQSHHRRELLPILIRRFAQVVRPISLSTEVLNISSSSRVSGVSDCSSTWLPGLAAMKWIIIITKINILILNHNLSLSALWRNWQLTSRAAQWPPFIHILTRNSSLVCKRITYSKHIIRFILSNEIN